MQTVADPLAAAECAEVGRDDSEPAEILSPDGVDLSLIQRMLSLTPLQRLEYLQGFVDSVVALRNGKWA